MRSLAQALNGTAVINYQGDSYDFPQHSAG